MNKDKGFNPAPIGKKRLSFNDKLARGFTLFELIIVIVILGILATLGLTHYGSYKESTLNREAQANLRLIIAAQKIYRMENGLYYPLAGGIAIDILNGINPNLRLSLSGAANRNWNYSTKSVVGPPNIACGQATRNGGDARSFRMLNLEDDPVAGTCP